MAQRIIRQLIDDLDQTEIPDGKGGSVEFALRGTTYRIDLSDSNIAKLEKAFAPFVEAAVRASENSSDGSSRNGAARSKTTATPARKGKPGRRAAKRTGGKSTETIRAWAAENGHEVSSRGRISAAVTQAYELAHASTT